MGLLDFPGDLHDIDLDTNFLSNPRGHFSPFPSHHKLCDMCTINPELDDAYVHCRSCEFNQMEDKELKCPQSYQKMYILNVSVGKRKNAELQGLVYTECKDQLLNGAKPHTCKINAWDLKFGIISEDESMERPVGKKSEETKEDDKITPEQRRKLEENYRYYYKAGHSSEGSQSTQIQEERHKHKKHKHEHEERERGERQNMGTMPHTIAHGVHTNQHNGLHGGKGGKRPVPRTHGDLTAAHSAKVRPCPPHRIGEGKDTRPGCYGPDGKWSMPTKCKDTRSDLTKGDCCKHPACGPNFGPVLCSDGKAPLVLEHHHTVCERSQQKRAAHHHAPQQQTSNTNQNMNNGNHNHLHKKKQEGQIWNQKMRTSNLNRQNSNQRVHHKPNSNNVVWLQQRAPGYLGPHPPPPPPGPLGPRHILPFDEDMEEGEGSEFGMFPFHDPLVVEYICTK